MGWLIVVATYAAIAAFYLRLGVHALRWWEAVRRSRPPRPRGAAAATRALAGTAVDIMLLRRLFLVNPALWVGEWVFHAALFTVVLRHLRYFTHPVPAWVVWAQTPGWIAGFVLPAALLYVLALRLLTTREKYTSRANVLMLLELLALGVTGLLLSTRYRADLQAVKVFALGIVGLSPALPPPDALFLVHLGLVLGLLLTVPSHVFTAPLSIMDARSRDLELRRVLHDA